MTKDQLSDLVFGEANIGVEPALTRAGCAELERSCQLITDREAQDPSAQLSPVEWSGDWVWWQGCSWGKDPLVEDRIGKMLVLRILHTMVYAQVFLEVAVGDHIRYKVINSGEFNIYNLNLRDVIGGSGRRFRRGKARKPSLMARKWYFLFQWKTSGREAIGQRLGFMAAKQVPFTICWC